MQDKSNPAVRKAGLSEAKRALLEKQLRGRPAVTMAAAAIPRRPDGDPPLSFSQQRLWFLDRLGGGSVAYNIPAALRLIGRLDIQAMEKAVNEILRRHEVLRTTFVESGGQPVQKVAPESWITIEVHDLSHLPESEREPEVLRLAREEGRRPFDLALGPLLSVLLLRLNEREHVLLFTLHHILSDGWSAAILFSEFAQFYRAFREKQVLALPELPIQFGDFAYWQRQWLRGERLEKQLAYWHDRLDGAPPLLDLPVDHPRPAVPSGRGAKHSFRLPQELTGHLRDLSRREGVTLFVTLVSAFNVLLHRYSGQSDFCLGVSVANRIRPEIEGLIGLFANMLVLRADLSGNPSFIDFLRRMQAVSIGAQTHQDLPFEKLVEEMNPARDRSYSPFFQVVFVLHNLPPRTMELPDLAVQPMDVDFGTAKSDLTLHVTEDQEGLQAAFEYSTDLFEAATIARMAGHFHLLLEAVTTNPLVRLSDLPLLSEAERRDLADWNRTTRPFPEDLCLHELFEAQARNNPERTAVISGSWRISYGELNLRADRLARSLRTLGVGTETRVGLYAERSVEAIVGILGVLKAGGAYVPLAPNHPPERVAELLSDCGATLLLARVSPAALRLNGIRILTLDKADGMEAAPLAHVTDGPQPDSAAYLIYTSGSTGKPKGVVVSHRNVLASNSARADFYREPPDGFLLVSPIYFDSSVAGIFWTLSRGGRLCIPPEGDHQDPRALAVLIHREGLSHLLCLPSLYGLLLDCADPPQLEGLRVAIVAGESCPPSLVAKHFADLPETRLYNEYGPTEATVWSSVHEITPADASDGTPISIGRPIANTLIYLLDPDLRSVPVGVPGEIYIGGAGIARGYHDQPGLTAERFVPDPFTGIAGARLYRTGDRARFHPDGKIEFMGRIDQQVKIRGFRIEPEEIEDRLRKYPGIGDAVVIAREDRPGEKRLTAYVVPSLGKDSAPPPETLREFLKDTLPDYMIPAAFVPLDRLPSNANGKLDRSALPAPDLAGQFAHRYRAPRGGLETRLAELWAETLGIERVGIHDNFFDLGGHSLAAVQLIVRVQQEFCGELSVASLFEAPTVAEFATLLEQDGNELDDLARELARLPEDQARRLLDELEI